MCRLVDFDVPVHHRVKIQGTEKKYKYLDFTPKLRKLWKMRMTVIPIIIGTRETVPEDLEKRPEDLEIGERMETPAFFQDRLEYWEGSWWPEETCSLLDSSKIPLANTGVKKNSTGVNW